MLVKRLVAYTHLSSTVSEIYHITGRILPHFYTPPLFSGPAGVIPSEFREDLDIHKTRMNGLSCGVEVMTRRSAVLIGCQRVTDRRTEGRTDRQTYVQPISITCFSIADARKNHLMKSDCLQHMSLRL